MHVLKQPPDGFCSKRCSYKFCKIHRKTSVLESPAQVFSCEFCELYKDTFLQNTSGRLLPHFELRLRSHERRNEFKPLWDFIWLKISLRFSVSSLFVFTWIEAKWNSKRYGFHIVNLTEMKFQTGMRFSCEHNLPETKWISADSLDIAFNAHVRLKLIAYINFISVILTEIKFHFEW